MPYEVDGDSYIQVAVPVSPAQHRGRHDRADQEPETEAGLEIRVLEVPTETNYRPGLADTDGISDGGGALVVTSAERARDLAKPPVLIQGCGEAICHREIGSPDLLTIAARQSADNAFGMSGLSRDDVDLCTIYDSFTITALVTLENLGFCKPGEGGAFVEGGERISIGGTLPLNTHGGQLSAGRTHGYGFVHEAVVQLRGDAGQRQVAGVEVAVTSSGGGHPGGAILFTTDRG
jgi:acetyl-CoA acetyltransferase